MAGDNGQQQGQRPQPRPSEDAVFTNAMGEPEPIFITGKAFDNKIVARGAGGRHMARECNSVADLLDVERDMIGGKFRAMPCLATQYFLLQASGNVRIAKRAE